MKTNKLNFLKTFLGMALAGLFLISYSCSPETDLDVLENLESVNASAKKSEEEARKKRPWKIRSSGSFEATGPSLFCDDPTKPLQILLEGDGNASHLGLYEVSITWCTDGDPGGPNNFIEGTLTAANGDLVYFKSLQFNGESVDYEVTGGDGRFEGADGQFTLFTTEFILEVGETGLPFGTYANEGGGFIIY